MFWSELMHTHPGRGEKQEWVFMETVHLLKCHNKKRVAVTNRPSELQAAKPIQSMALSERKGWSKGSNEADIHQRTKSRSEHRARSKTAPDLPNEV